MTADRCKCSHVRSTHSDTSGWCWAAVCGCTEFRPRGDKPWPPVRWDDLEPRRSVDMGSARVDYWPEEYEVAE